ncbi:hypothetical protein [Nonlabens xiamenensis]|uniref:hypothetical protein n=1 Tax=Nonlabens xiamenensis TaxID=2341043 RepID=UPI000F6056F3|nr:hypothetical protein [Nonlabens xiamenensis]
MNSLKTFFLSLYFEIQSTFILLREVFVTHSFSLSSKIYVFFKSGPSWKLHTRQLLTYPPKSLGYHLGCFLLQHKFEPQPKCEDHDIFHVITGYGVTTADEIAMQYWLWGNGKRSPFVLLAMAVGLVLYPEKYQSFKTAYIKGRLSRPIHQLDFKRHLSSPMDLFATITTTQIIKN